MFFGKIKIDTPDDFINPNAGLSTCEDNLFSVRYSLPVTAVKRHKNNFSSELDKMIQDIKSNFEIVTLAEVSRLLNCPTFDVRHLDKYVTFFHVGEPSVFSTDNNGSDGFFPSVGFSLCAEMQIVVTDTPFVNAEYSKEMNFFAPKDSESSHISEDLRDKILSELIDTSQGRLKIAASLCCPLMFSWEKSKSKDFLEGIKNEKDKKELELKQLNDKVQDIKQQMDVSTKEIENVLNSAIGYVEILNEKNIKWLDENTISVKLSPETRVPIEKICGKYVPIPSTISTGNFIGGMLAISAINKVVENYFKNDSPLKEITE